MRYFLIALTLVLTLAGCSRPALQEQQSFVFGTRVEVLVVSDDAEQGRQAIATVLREFDRLHRTYHAWQPSELTALNADIAAGKPHKVTPELAGFIREAQGMAKQGDYLFDPGIGELIKIWGFESDDFRTTLPAQADIDRWLAEKPSIADLSIGDDDVVTSRNRHVALDFGGYLKGVALDKAAAILRQQGIANALINIGGNVMALGSKEGKPWRIGIQDPRSSGPLATVNLNDGEAIGTSGDYQRYFEVGGKRYCHLLDPRTGYPADQTEAVTVLIPAGPKAGTLSDGSSKPIFIAGPEHWREAARQMKIGMVLRVDRNGKLFVTQALDKRLEFIGKAPEITVVP